MSFLDDSPSYYPSSGNLGALSDSKSTRLKQAAKKNKFNLSDDSDDDDILGGEKSDGSADSSPEEIQVRSKFHLQEKSKNINKPVAQKFSSKKPNKSEVYEQMLNIESEELKLFEKTSLEKENEESLFLKSLLPYLEQVPQTKMLLCRQKIISVILSFLPHQDQGIISH